MVAPRTATPAEAPSPSADSAGVPQPLGSHLGGPTPGDWGRSPNHNTPSSCQNGAASGRTLSADLIHNSYLPLPKRGNSTDPLLHLILAKGPTSLTCEHNGLLPGPFGLRLRG